MMQRGGVQATVPIPNRENTCLLDAYINSILNSHSLSKYLLQFSTEDNIKQKDKILYTKFKKNLEKYTSTNVFYEYLLSVYVRIYYTIANNLSRNSLLNYIRLYIEYIHNAEEYEGESLPIGKTIEFMARFFDMRFQEYKKTIDEGDESISGESVDIISEMFSKCPHVIYTRNIFPSIMQDTTDVYIYYENTCMPNAQKIDEKIMNRFNEIYRDACAHYGDFICTDIILDQFVIGDTESEHSAFYNLLENNIQNENNASHVPFEELMFNVGACKDISTLIDNGLKRKTPVSTYKTINVGFYDSQGLLGFYIPSVLHFQRIQGSSSFSNPIPYTVDSILSRLNFIKRTIQSQIDVPEFMPKYTRHLSKITEAINFYKEPKQDSVDSLRHNPYSQFEKIGHPGAGCVIHITKYLKDRTRIGKEKFKIAISLPTSFSYYSRFIDIVA